MTDANPHLRSTLRPTSQAGRHTTPDEQGRTSSPCDVPTSPPIGTDDARNRPTNPENRPRETGWSFPSVETVQGSTTKPGPSGSSLEAFDRAGKANRAGRRAKSMRPIEAFEVPYLENLGELVRRERNRRNLTRRSVAEAAAMNTRTLEDIEDGTRRTRASTLGRIVGALVAVDGSADDLHAAFVAAAGPALAPESRYPERVARRRDRRLRKHERLLELAAPLAEQLAREWAKDLAAERVRELGWQAGKRLYPTKRKAG